MSSLPGHYTFDGWPPLVRGVVVPYSLELLIMGLTVLYGMFKVWAILINKPCLISFQNYSWGLFKWLFGLQEAVCLNIFSYNLWGLQGTGAFIVRPCGTLTEHRWTPFN